MATAYEDASGFGWTFGRAGFSGDQNLPCENAVALADEFRRRGRHAEADALLKCNSVMITRGRYPSTGCVCMLKQEFDKLDDPSDARHVVKFTDGTNEGTTRLANFAVTRAVPLIPGFEKQPQRTSANPLHFSEVVPTTPLVVEFADARYYAPTYSAIDEWFNQRTPANVRFTRPGALGDKLSYRSIAEFIWGGFGDRGSLARLFGSTVAFDLVGESSPPPENLEFYGMSRWDALWVLMDIAGWSLRLTDEGNPVIFNFEAEKEADQSANASLIDDASTELIDAGNVFDDPLPEDVQVTTVQRNYQFDAETLTPGDHWQKFPTHSENFRTSRLIDPKHPISAGTTAHIWGAIPFIFDENETVTNEDEILQHLQDIAIAYLRQINEAQHREYEWIGPQNIRPFNTFSGVLFHHHGPFRTVGLNYGLAEPRWNDGQVAWELPWRGEEARPRISSASPHPYSRQFFGLILDTYPLSSPAGLNALIEDGQWCRVSVLKGLTDENAGVSWGGIAAVLALNATGGTILTGQRCHAVWNYQLGTGGEWCIVAARHTRGPEGEPDAFADWIAESIPQLTPVAAAEDTGLIRVNRRSMLRLVREGGARTLTPADSDEEITQGVIPDLQFGPPNSVLWTGSGEDEQSEAGTIYWTDGPVLNNVRVKGWVKFGKEPADSWLGPPRGQRIKMRLPPAASQSGQVIISTGVGGSCTETEFFGPGRDCTIQYATECFDPATILDFLCLYVQNCADFGQWWGSGPQPPIYSTCEVKTLSFEKGLLLQGPNCSTPPSSGSASCDDVPDENWNPVTRSTLE